MRIHKQISLKNHLQSYINVTFYCLLRVELSPPSPAPPKDIEALTPNISECNSFEKHSANDQVRMKFWGQCLLQYHYILIIMRNLDIKTNWKDNYVAASQGLPKIVSKSLKVSGGAWNRFFITILRMTNSATDILVLHFQPPVPWDDKFLLFKSFSSWFFTMEATRN